MLNYHYPFIQTYESTSQIVSPSFTYPLHYQSSIFQSYQQANFLSTDLTLSAYGMQQKLNHIDQVFNQYHFTKTYHRCIPQSKASLFNPKSRLEVSGHHLTPSTLSVIKNQLLKYGIETQISPPLKIPWFPTKLQHVNLIGKTLYHNQILYNQDHPYFIDPYYVQRKNQITEIAHNYLIKDPIPNINYTSQENSLWAHILKKLIPLHKVHFSQRYLYNFEKLNTNFNIHNRIPQLSELSDYLIDQTGFRIKPVHGIINPRQFLNALAFRVFLSTQYIRHPKFPDYTPEPDIVHEIIGHIPMFADKEVADLSQKIGQISLGASDEQIVKLGTLYFLTVQFGICREKGKNKIYGAGFASCVKQIQKFASQKAQFMDLQVERDCTTEITTLDLQKIYFVTDTIENGFQQIKSYGSRVVKQVETVYNSETQQILLNRNVEFI